MIGDREADRTTDVAVIWFGHGVELAQRLEAFIADRRDHTADPAQLLADLEQLLHADFEPGTDPLFDPATAAMETDPRYGIWGAQ